MPFLNHSAYNKKMKKLKKFHILTFFCNILFYILFIMFTIERRIFII